VLWLGGIAAIWPVALLTARYLPPKIGEPLAGVFIISLFIAFGITGLQLQTFSCPRCGDNFSSNGFDQYSVFARKCVHCGLKKFSIE
jgi:hypothetical protein